MEFEAVIGLEVHAQLKTESKLFCGCATAFGSRPNSNICAVCTGQPGVLPVLNEKALELTVKTGLAANCAISEFSVFARKHYFYPDLPKNYQISQYEQPLCGRGYLEISVNGVNKKIGITRIHLEEDAGKLLHMIGSRELDSTYVDYNRAGIPLMEIVSEPDISSPEEAYEYLVKLKQILEYIEVSDCNMEEGKLRCDANISIRPVGAQKLGTKTELKNMNSFKAVKEAVSYEIARQKGVVAAGGRISQETRLWNAQSGKTEVMRSKEEAQDYRYFPEPDLTPVEFKHDYIQKIKAEVGELADFKKNRYIFEFGLSEYDAGVLTSKKGIADYFESALKCADSLDFPKAEKAKVAANYITNELLGRLNKLQLEFAASPIGPDNLADLMGRLLKNELSNKIAKSVLDEVFASGKSVAQVINEKGLKQITDVKELEAVASEAISANPQAVKQFLEGKEKALGAIVGYIMQKTQGKADPRIINRLLKEKINNSNQA